MVIADIKGKLTIHEEVSEDFLTSVVFFAFDLLNKKWLNNFLISASNLLGEKLDLENSECLFEFWKSFSKPYGVEPDVLILCNNLLIIIETKFNSGKSGVSYKVQENYNDKQNEIFLYDQLAREYFIGAELINKGLLYKDEIHRFSDFVMIYITKDDYFPMDEIRESIETITFVDPSQTTICQKKIFWTNWQQLIPIMREIIDTQSKQSIEYKIADQLIIFLEKRGLLQFSGFSQIGYQVDDFPLITSTIIYDSGALVSKYWTEIIKGEFSFPNSDIYFYSNNEKYWNDPIFNDIIPFLYYSIYNEKTVYWQTILESSVELKPSIIFYADK